MIRIKRYCELLKRCNFFFRIMLVAVGESKRITITTNLLRQLASVHWEQ